MKPPFQLMLEVLTPAEEIVVTVRGAGFTAEEAFDDLMNYLDAAISGYDEPSEDLNESDPPS